jgi:PAS domain S-box-containing protein
MLKGTSNEVLDAFSVGIIVLTADARVAYWNDWIAAATGIASDQANGKSLSELFPGVTLNRVNAAAILAFNSGVASLITHALHPHLLPLRTRSGKALIHNIMVAAVGRSRPFSQCLIQVIDITEATEREVVLRKRQNARYAAVVDSAQDVILTLDRDGTIQLANPATTKQLGYKPEDLVGRPAEVLFEEKSAWVELWRTIANAEGAPQPAQIAARRKDGSLSYLEVSASRWVSDKRTFVSAILRDINERRQIEEVLRDMNVTLEQRVEERTAQLTQAEEALRQSQKMEAVGQLTGGIAHDFNNLLQGIMGSLDRIQKRVSEGRINEIEKFLQAALTSAKRAAALTHRLLAFSRRQPVDPRPVDISQLVNSIEELAKRSLGERILMNVVTDENLWLVRCDPNQLENAVLNLAINARDAMPGGGSLTIEIRNKTLSASQAKVHDLSAGEYVQLSVKDTGTGMPPNVRARAFDPFYTTKPIGQGTGLGLSMIYGFVRQSDGAVWIESEPGKGTAIQICLPRFVGDLEMETASAKQTIGHIVSNKVVLVVEDEFLVRLLIVEILGDLGYHALEACDGASGLRILDSAQHIDLLITDIGLPGLNGRQLADAAREKRPAVKILFMTGYAETAAGSDFLGEGMEIIAKPFDLNVLASRIRTIVGT